MGGGEGEGDGWSPEALCVVCFELPRGVALRCGHDDFCATCVTKFDTCPLCREPTGRARPATTEVASSGLRGPARRRLLHGHLMRHRGGAACFAAVVALMLYTLVLMILSSAGVDIRCKGFPLVPGGESEATCKEEFGEEYGQCTQGICQMAPAYVLSNCHGTVRPFCGTYLRMEDNYCQGAPVYLKNGRQGGQVLFRFRSTDELSDVTVWAVGPYTDVLDNCLLGDVVYMLSRPSSFPLGPDSPNYSPWVFPTGTQVIVTTSSGRGDSNGLCAGVACGSYSKCVVDQDGFPSCKCTGNRAGKFCAKSCGDHGISNGDTCRCQDGYIGEFCDVALPAGFANGYSLTGCPPPPPHVGSSECSGECLCGNFTRTLLTCDGVPTYWRQRDPTARLPPGMTDHGASLFRHTVDNISTWITSSSVVVSSCNRTKGGLQSAGVVLGRRDAAGAPDEAEFQRWSSCNYKDDCVAMPPDFQVTAITGNRPGHA